MKDRSKTMRVDMMAQLQNTLKKRKNRKSLQNLYQELD